MVNVARLSTKSEAKTTNHIPSKIIPMSGRNPPLKNSLQRGENLSLLEREGLGYILILTFFLRVNEFSETLKKKERLSKMENTAT